MPSPHGKVVFVLTRIQADLLAALSRGGGSGTFDSQAERTSILWLRRRGLVAHVDDGWRVVLTDAGREAAAIASRLVGPSPKS